MGAERKNSDGREAIEAALWAQFEANRTNEIGFAVNNGATTDDAEDARQEAYLRAWRALGRFEGGPEMIHPWVYKILANHSRSLARKRRTHHTVFGDEVIWEEGSPIENVPDEIGETDDDIHRRLEVGELISSIPGRKGGLIFMEYLGYRNPEIAAEFGTTDNAIKVQKHHVHAAIRESHPDLAER